MKNSLTLWAFVFRSTLRYPQNAPALTLMKLQKIAQWMFLLYCSIFRPIHTNINLVSVFISSRKAVAKSWAIPAGIWRMCLYGYWWSRLLLYRLIKGIEFLSSSDWFRHSVWMLLYFQSTSLYKMYGTFNCVVIQTRISRSI